MAASSNPPHKAAMAAIGNKLREAREKKSLTVDQAQKQTRINYTVITALEEGRCDEILNPTYVRSFLKKYADYLGLDSRRLLDEYRQVRPDTERQAFRPLKEPDADEEGSPAFFRILPAIRFIAAFAIIVFIVIFAGGKVVGLFKKPKPVKTASALKSSSAARTSQASKKRAVRKKASNPVLIPKSVPLKLVLKVKRDVLVKLRVDGNLMFGKVLPRGTTEEFTAKNVINIFVAKGDYIELILNGKSFGSPGKGVLDNVEITRSGVRVK